jgi:hypothetical protein
MRWLGPGDILRRLLVCRQYRTSCGSSHSLHRNLRYHEGIAFDADVLVRYINGHSELLLADDRADFNRVGFGLFDLADATLGTYDSDLCGPDGLMRNTITSGRRSSEPEVNWD